MEDQDYPQSSFQFHGNWKAFAKIALPNLLLTIVTLGVYRFWATTRERQYLWGCTQFIDEYLEWTGTGKELFKGFLIAIVGFILPLYLLNFAFEWALSSGHPILALIVYGLLLAVAVFVGGFAQFRALRYRLSRTFWRGIRGGGSADRGFAYGFSALWRTGLGILTLGLMVPWSQTTLWNARWSQMRFGTLAFASDARARPIFARYLLVYLIPLVIALMMFATIATEGGYVGDTFVYSNFPPVLAAVALLVITVGGLVLIGLIYVAYYAAFLREAINATRLDTTGFSFEATVDDWIKLYLGHAALLIGTLGLGYIFLSYRNWKFFITHLEANGEIDFNRLTQADAGGIKQGEGLLDALDMGSF